MFAYRRLQELWKGRWSIGELVAFHTAHKYLLLAHSQKDYRVLGPLVAAAREMPREELREAYESRFMEALKRIASPAKHANVLQHMLGFFKRELDAASRAELVAHVEDYRQGRTPLIVPLTLIG
ncbi:MAG: YbgA family protein, partial [Thermoguttaceae bacterium]